ncbi:UDP-N-acetylmuramoyl-tripeptide--D-alanyl-D-alanine ligase [Ammoniphilus sp. CFH 90114]|uniref:Mur ligase family protein n=1 Tax=Ammoniphilus sp. CFH 90114 TaxID=2493665 RepID=UPI00100FCD21|nr:UDP-N-acetylmuramoyl-tripeptide--D-alanyl-D-alanine ligase [Ammoniphilus sp. CFH 90114]RXT13999.1 UDP-N-acetylmuramoyl-tripeptide--D-alanyl-D-alanine ligase [Ammoniphilus sp. CFH 90114]
MKPLMLVDIVGTIDGMVLTGAENQKVTDVAVSRKQMRNNILYFHVRQSKDRFLLRRLQRLQQVVVVTDKPERFERIKHKLTLIQVRSVGVAFKKFVHYYRLLFHIPIFGITGTNGKSTTKEMITYLLSKDRNVVSTYKSRNGLKQSLRYLLNIGDETDAAVIEMGVKYPGNLAYNCQLFKPQVRVILNIEVNHTRDIKTMDNYIRAKGEILEGFDYQNHKLIINADDENTQKLNLTRVKNLITVGKKSDADYRAEEIRYVGNGMSFTLMHKGNRHAAYVPGYGEHTVYNALAAIASVCQIGISIEEAIKRLASFRHIEKHLEFCKGLKGSTIIDDTWNCTPSAIRAALEVLKEVSNGRKKVLVIGHMPAIARDPFGMDQYKKIAKIIFKANVDRLIVAETRAREFGEKAIEHGMDPRKVIYCTSASEVFEVVNRLIDQKTMVLLKYSLKYMPPSYKSVRGNLVLNL